MNAIKLILAALGLTVICATTSSAAFLTPEPDRITDETIAADIKSIDSIQARLAQVNSKKGVPVKNYHFAKAQAWIDFAREEYSINDRSAVVEEALKQAYDLIWEMEEGKKDIAMGTPIISTSKLVRQDMWELAERLKKHEGFHCGEDKVAQFEVQLVWSGHEDAEMGWRHSKPYLQAAERLAKEAELLIYPCKEREAAINKLPACIDPLSKPGGKPLDTAGVESDSPTAGVIVADEDEDDEGDEEPVEVIVSSQLIVSLPDRVHFALDREEISVISSAVLDRIVTSMRDNPKLRIELRGHADERASIQYNQSLSERRASSVKTYLLAAGITDDRITLHAFGKTQPLDNDRSVLGFARNRRVEFVFSGSDAINTAPQFEDVQVEKRLK